MFRGINKNLAGIGVISVYSSYMFSWYYNVIVAWAGVYAIVGFFVPLPWSKSIPKDKFPCLDKGIDGDKVISRAEIYYKINVIRLVNKDTCKAYKDGQETTFSWPALSATFITWFIIFLCV